MLKLIKFRNRIVAKLKLQGVIPMPTIMPVNWSDNNIKVNIQPSGWQKIPLFKFLSGTYLKIKGSFKNSSKDTKGVSCNCTLFRLSGTDKPADIMHQVRDYLNSNQRALKSGSGISVSFLPKVIM